MTILNVLQDLNKKIFKKKTEIRPVVKLLSKNLHKFDFSNVFLGTYKNFVIGGDFSFFGILFNNKKLIGRLVDFTEDEMNYLIKNFSEYRKHHKSLNNFPDVNSKEAIEMAEKLLINAAK